MKLAFAALLLAGGGGRYDNNNKVNAFSSFAFENTSNGNAKKQGWDPSPFQQQQQKSKVSKEEGGALPLKTSSSKDDTSSVRPSFPSAPTNVNDLSASINPVPFAATKADESKVKDIFNPLVRPIAFTKEEEDAKEMGTEDTFAAKVSPPRFKQPAEEVSAQEILQLSTDSERSDTSFVAPQAATVKTNLEAESFTESTGTASVEKEKTKADPSSTSPRPSNDGSNNNNNRDPILGDDSTMTERMLKKVPSTEGQTGGAGGQSTLEAFKR
ncbi:MAG: hypothetical protein SGILL_003942, partial [Bacillariaceae sp.]